MGRDRGRGTLPRNVFHKNLQFFKDFTKFRASATTENWVAVSPINSFDFCNRACLVFTLLYDMESQTIFGAACRPYLLNNLDHFTMFTRTSRNEAPILISAPCQNDARACTSNIAFQCSDLVVFHSILALTWAVSPAVSPFNRHRSHIKVSWWKGNVGAKNWYVCFLRMGQETPPPEMFSQKCIFFTHFTKFRASATKKYFGSVPQPIGRYPFSLTTFGVVLV